MLAAIIRANGRPQALAATFAVLIPAVAAGVLGHAVVVDPLSDPETERLAEVTGASYVAAGGDGWQAGAGHARGDWLILLEAGDVPGMLWAQDVERHLLTSAARPALIPSTGLAASLKERAALSFGPRRLRSGLIAPKGLVQAGRLNTAPRRLSVRRERSPG